MAEQELQEGIEEILIDWDWLNETNDDIASKITKKIKQAGYVRLAKDQAMPRSETAVHRFGEENDGYNEGKRVMYMAMLEAGFRKVELVATTKEG